MDRVQIKGAYFSVIPALPVEVEALFYRILLIFNKYKTKRVLAKEH